MIINECRIGEYGKVGNQLVVPMGWYSTFSFDLARGFAMNDMARAFADRVKTPFRLIP
jgi:hypothetical protein